jgi:hypothetical protein
MEGRRAIRLPDVHVHACLEEAANGSLIATLGRIEQSMVGIRAEDGSEKKQRNEAGRQAKRAQGLSRAFERRRW